MDLREVAEALYAAPAAEFVERRSAAAADAGDRDLAREIRGFRKPTAAAAAVNALVRDDPDAVHDVLGIGDRLRDAFAGRDREAIRELTRERQHLLQAVTRDLGLSAAVAREVEETLQAAVVDPAAAAAVRSGMLLRALQSTGVDDVDVSDAVALPVDTSAAPPRRPPRAAKQAAQEADETPRETASERRESQRRIRTAEKAVERARADADGLDDELDATVDRRTDLDDERETLERRLERTTEELAEARAAERDLRKRITAAQASLREAERTLRDARADS